MRSDSRRWRVRPLEWTLLVVGLTCLGWYGWRADRIHRLQTEDGATVGRLLSAPRRADIEMPAPQPGELIGRLDIPRLRISAVVKEGEDEGVLDYAVGFLKDTPAPWLPGNSALAAHRDRLFRPLEHVRIGDDIRLSTTHGELRYRVLRTLIVDPKDVWVLDAMPRVNLTLITCYPFTYVGNAPRRFIVQAEKIDQRVSSATNAST